MSPRVSVVMCAYQAARTVGGSVSSVLRQTYGDIELVVVDDGSTDATSDIVGSHAGPIVLVRQENTGVAEARNRGIRQATGELITFCDADDLLFDRHLEALVDIYDRRGGIVAANAWWLFPGGIDRSKTRHKGRFPRPEQQRRAILEQNFVPIMSLFPRRMFDEIGPFAGDLRRAEDWDFWMRAIFAGYRVHSQPRPLMLCRWGESGLSSSPPEMDASVRDVLRRAAERLPLTSEERSYVEQRLAGPGPAELTRRALAAMREGRYAEATRLHRDAAALCPSESRLLWKARLLSGAPWLMAPILRARQLRIERRLAVDERHVR